MSNKLKQVPGQKLQRKKKTEFLLDTKLPGEKLIEHTHTFCRSANQDKVLPGLGIDSARHRRKSGGGKNLAFWGQNFADKRPRGLGSNRPQFETGKCF